jgi:hypothetical protein
MDKENVVFMQNGGLFSHKKNEIMLFVGKCIKPDIIMLNEISQAQKEISHVLSCKQDLDLRAKK